jgi:HAD superfamily hydrolase (TIGR01549 family)
VDRAQAFLFDLDGTLVDSVYQHVLAWRDALNHLGIDLSVWRIHRKVGMSGGLFANALLRETGREVTREQAAELRRLHAVAYAEHVKDVRPLPGARELLTYLTDVGVPWAIATSGYRESADPALEMLEIPPGVPLITRDLVEHAKPDPDLFLAAADALGMSAENCVVVGDSVWDLPALRRVRARGARTSRRVPGLRRPGRPPSPPRRGRRPPSGSRPRLSPSAGPRPCTTRSCHATSSPRRPRQTPP